MTMPNYVSNQGNINSYLDSMLVLPNGQVLLTSGTSPQSAGSVDFYNLAPGDGPNPTWAPTISSFTQNANGSYTLTGTQLNGRDEGAAYGDDEQMAENYPIVQLVDLFNGEVFYATTSNWSSAGVATGSTPETVNVALPPGIGGNNGIEVPFLVFAIANGIPSVPIVRFFVGPGGEAGAEIVVNGTPTSPSGASHFPSLSAPTVPITTDNSSPVVPPTSNIMNAPSTPTYAPGPKVDFSSNNSVAVAPPLSQMTHFNRELNDTESIQWAGLNSALDILSA